DEHVVGFVPRPTQYIPPPGVRLRPYPFLYVARHVVVAPRAHVLSAAYGKYAGIAEVTRRYDKRCGTRPCRAVPVIDRRQALPCELRVCRRFIPADASHRKRVLPCGIFTLRPFFRSKPAGRVSKLQHGFIPGELFSFFAKGGFPVITLL